MNFLKRAYIWCKRFRYRRGYGVHSPFAFGLLTDVVYERSPYYAYKDLEPLQCALPKDSLRYPQRVNRLLFRLANHFSPQYIVEVGTGGGLSIRYLAAAKSGAVCVTLCADEPEGRVSDLIDGCKNATLLVGEELQLLREELELHSQIGLLHIAHTVYYQEAFELALSHAGKDTVFVVGNIYANREKQEWWKRVVADERTGITFDLYDVGIVFFDHTKNKQHYVVNF